MFYFLQFDETKLLFQIFHKENIEARFVGGVVRDTIAFEAKEMPDLDIAVNCDITKLLSILNLHGIQCVTHSIAYGTLTIFINKRKFELTELRQDFNCSGRKCLTKQTSSFEQDAKRRDFTINALYVSQGGVLFDFFNGVKDLQEKRVNFIGEPQERIAEDYLRILRYYRFCAKYGDTTNQYIKIIQSNAHHLTMLSVERTQSEFFKILESRYCQEILILMNRTSIFKHIFLNININKLQYTNGISLEAKLCILFPYKDLLEIFKLTKAQKSTIKQYKKFENEDIAYAYYKTSFKFFQDLAAIKYSTKKTPEFLLQFKDLDENTSYQKAKLQLCEKWWAMNNFQKTKDECLNFIKNLKI